MCIWETEILVVLSEKRDAKILSGYFCKLWLMCIVAPQLKLSDDRLTVTGEKGYSMARATHGTYTMDLLQ